LQIDLKLSIRPDRSPDRHCRSLLKICLVVVLPAAVWLGPLAAGAQGMRAGDIFGFGAQAIGLVTRESPGIHGRDLTEGYLSQPALMATVTPWGEALTLKATLNLEGLTIKRGELTPGIAGEGYIDRRHPHTYLHEILLTSAHRFRADGVSGASITVGKGFAPFGRDRGGARGAVDFRGGRVQWRRADWSRRCAQSKSILGFVVGPIDVRPLATR
jgi:hypothetical protein